MELCRRLGGAVSEAVELQKAPGKAQAPRREQPSQMKIIFCQDHMYKRWIATCPKNDPKVMKTKFLKIVLVVGVVSNHGATSS